MTKVTLWPWLSCTSTTTSPHGYTLDQEGYIAEILRARGVGEHEKSLVPASKEWMSLEPESFPSEYTPEVLKEAQSRTGELSWLCQRTRPDLSYAVNIMSSLVIPRGLV